MHTERENIAREAIRVLTVIDPAEYHHPAVVFDIDDTLIDSRTRRVIPGVRNLYNYAREIGYSVFLITARDPRHFEVTTNQLSSRDIVGYSGLYMVPYAERPRKGEAKAKIREDIERHGYTIVMNIGDDPSDFTGGFYRWGLKLPHYLRE